MEFYIKSIFYYNKKITNFNVLLGNVRTLPTLSPPSLDLPSTGCLHNVCNCPLALA